MASLHCKAAGCHNPRHVGKEFCLEHYKQTDGYTYGMDSEIKAKLSAKLSPEKMAEAQAWVEAVTGESFHADFQESLKDGQILCKLLNKIRPSLVKNVSTSNMPFKQMENISKYLDGCKELGLKETDLFVTKDLYESANLVSVIDNLYALSALAQSLGYHGPSIGVKLATENKRNFTEEQLRQAAAAIPAISRGDFGVQDETHNPSLNRQIIKNVSGYESTDSGPTMITKGSYGVADAPGVSGIDKIIRNPDLIRRGADTSAAPAVVSPRSAAAPKFCGNCGKPRGAGKFCGECGSQL